MEPISRQYTNASPALATFSPIEQSERVSSTPPVNSDQSIAEIVSLSSISIGLQQEDKPELKTKYQQSSESVAVSTSVGPSVISSGLTNEEALSLYRKVAQFL